MTRFLLVLSISISFLAITPLVPQPVFAADCKTANNSCDCSSSNITKDNCGIVYYLWLFINVLSALVGIVLVISLVVAGIQWTTAGDNPQQISAAKTRIFNILIAALVFIFMYAFLQWVVPGGVL